MPCGCYLVIETANAEHTKAKGPPIGLIIPMSTTRWTLLSVTTWDAGAEVLESTQLISLVLVSAAHGMEVSKTTEPLRGTGEDM